MYRLIFITIAFIILLTSCNPRDEIYDDQDLYNVVVRKYYKTTGFFEDDDGLMGGGCSSNRYFYKYLVDTRMHSTNELYGQFYLYSNDFEYFEGDTMLFIKQVITPAQDSSQIAE